MVSDFFIFVFILKHLFINKHRFQDEVTAQVKVLLDLKAQYQKAAGKAWQPGAKADTKAAKSGVETSSAPGGSDSKQVDELLGKIEAQGNKVRQLKGSGASKVRTLISHRAQCFLYVQQIFPL